MWLKTAYFSECIYYIIILYRKKLKKFCKNASCLEYIYLQGMKSNLQKKLKFVCKNVSCLEYIYLQGMKNGLQKKLKKFCKKEESCQYIIYETNK